MGILNLDNGAMTPNVQIAMGLVKKMIKFVIIVRVLGLLQMICKGIIL
jgi:hypothetical protein